MIQDVLNNFASILPLNPLFDKVLDYLKTHDLSKMELGKTVLEENRLFFTIMEVDGKTAEAAKMEAHQNFLDIQIVLEGSESMGWASLDRCKNPMDAYHAEKDIVFYNDQPSSYATVHPGEFVVFFPKDVHAPCIGTGKIKKAVFKVLV